MCHCEEGWKGPDCDVPIAECQVPGCSGHGRCIEGECHCERGWKGLFCEQCEYNFFFFWLTLLEFDPLTNFTADCMDPSCSGHGTCVNGQCYCKAGWQSDDCSIVDQQVYQCLPGCSEHGTYDLETGSCVCERHWTGSDCSQGKFSFSIF